MPLVRHVAGDSLIRSLEKSLFCLLAEATWQIKKEK